MEALPKSIATGPLLAGCIEATIHRLDDGRFVIPEDDLVGLMFGKLDDYGLLPGMVRMAAPGFVEFWHGDGIVVGYTPGHAARILLQIFSDARLTAEGPDGGDDHPAHRVATDVGHLCSSLLTATLEGLFAAGPVKSEPR